MNNNDWEPTVRVPVGFEKREGDRVLRVQLTRFGDSTAYIEGDEEVGFEQGSEPWRNALEYLKKRGYQRAE